MPNPLTFRVKQMQSFHVKIRVMDEDKNSNDFVGDFVTSIVALPVGVNGRQQPKARIVRRLRADRNLEIKFELWGLCDRNFYGLNCDVKCQPQNSRLRGFYTCDETTGAKICREGYTGKDCRRTNFCASNPCKNNGACVSSVAGSVCRCTSGFEGLRCDQPVNPCANNPCRNGATCTQVEGKPRCECPRGFIGTLCDRDLDECFQATPCLNNGTCKNTIGSFSCACTSGFSGSRCERPIKLAPASEEFRQNIPQPASQQAAHAAAAKELRDNSKQSAMTNPVDNNSKELLWPYLVAVAAVLVAVVCLALLVTIYRRRRFVVIKERSGDSVTYTASPQSQGNAENIYVSDNDSDGTIYDDIDANLGERAPSMDEMYEEMPNDFANDSYGGIPSSVEQV